MSSLKYVGAGPVADADIANDAYVLSLLAQNLAQPAVDALIVAGLASYATKTYVDAQDALNATKAYIDAADATRLHLSAIGTHGGPVGLDENGWIDPAVISIPSTQRWPGPGASPGSYNTEVSVTTDTTIYTEVVTDPGYPYNLLVFGSVDVSTFADGVTPLITVRAGTDTGPLVGTGYGAPESYGVAPVFDAVGTGFTGNTQNFTFSHIAVEHAYVIVDIAVRDGPTVSTATYGGLPMTFLGSQVINTIGNGILVRYGLADVAPGTKTVAIGLSAAAYVTACSVSYLNVANVSTMGKITGTGAPIAYNVTTVLTPAQVLVEAFACRQAASLLTPSGGVNRFNSGDFDSGTFYSDLSISDATAATNFTATGTTVGNWAGIANILTSNNYSTAVIEPFYASMPASTPVFDAASAGQLANKATNFSFTHTAAADAYVVIDVCALGGAMIVSCSYDGVALTALATRGLNNNTATGVLARYGVANTTAGTKTIAIVLSASGYVTASSVSYRGVKSVGASTSVYAAGTNSLSEPVSVYAYGGQIAVQAFAADQVHPQWTVSGGTKRREVSFDSGGGVFQAELTVSDAVASTTFVAVSSISNAAGIVTLLSGVLGTPAQSGRTGDTTLYVRLAPSSAGTVSATGVRPALTAIPIPA